MKLLGKPVLEFTPKERFVTVELVTDGDAFTPPLELPAEEETAEGGQLFVA